MRPSVCMSLCAWRDAYQYNCCFAVHTSSSFLPFFFSCLVWLNRSEYENWGTRSISKYSIVQHRSFCSDDARLWQTAEQKQQQKEESEKEIQRNDTRMMQKTERASKRQKSFSFQTFSVSLLWAAHSSTFILSFFCLLSGAVILHIAHASFYIFGTFIYSPMQFSDKWTDHWPMDCDKTECLCSVHSVQLTSQLVLLITYMQLLSSLPRNEIPSNPSNHFSIWTQEMRTGKQRHTRGWNQYYCNNEEFVREQDKDLRWMTDSPNLSSPFFPFYFERSNGISVYENK